ncbi:hypothetical protein B566_EDAN002132 [Ephemera danica]|nr:hypothetical protein B566_EDAN002132 [Ephemera danica]
MHLPWMRLMSGPSVYKMRRFLRERRRGATGRTKTSRNTVDTEDARNLDIAEKTSAPEKTTISAMKTSTLAGKPTTMKFQDSSTNTPKTSVTIDSTTRTAVKNEGNTITFAGTLMVTTAAEQNTITNQGITATTESTVITTTTESTVITATTESTVITTTTESTFTTTTTESTFTTTTTESTVITTTTESTVITTTPTTLAASSTATTTLSTTTTTVSTTTVTTTTTENTLALYGYKSRPMSSAELQDAEKYESVLWEQRKQGWDPKSGITPTFTDLPELATGVYFTASGEMAGKRMKIKETGPSSVVVCSSILLTEL